MSEEQAQVIEENLDEAIDRMLSEGVQRLERGWSALLATGTVAGLEVAMGILLLLVVDERTGDPMLGGLAFSAGFLALLLGHSELFTEGFLIPVLTVTAKKAGVGSLVRFWVATLVTNLAGGWVMTWFIMEAFPDLAGEARRLAGEFLGAGFGVHSLALGILAGAAITLMTRMQHGTDSMSGKMAAAVAAAFLLAGLPLFHSILDSLVIFAAFHAGGTPFGYEDWARWLGWTILWNMCGGIGLVTLLRLVRSRKRIQHERARGPTRPPAERVS